MINRQVGKKERNDLAEGVGTGGGQSKVLSVDGGRVSVANNGCLEIEKEPCLGMNTWVRDARDNLLHQTTPERMQKSGDYEFGVLGQFNKRRLDEGGDLSTVKERKSPGRTREHAAESKAENVFLQQKKEGRGQGPRKHSAPESALKGQRRIVGDCDLCEKGISKSGP